MAKRNSKKTDAQIDALVAQTVEKIPGWTEADMKATAEGIVQDMLDQGFTFAPETMTPVEEVQLDQVLDQVQADEVIEVQATEASDEPAEKMSWGDMMKEVPQDVVTRTMNHMKDRIADRRQLEIAKNSYNDNIQRTLKNVELTMVRPVAAQVLVAACVSPDFIVEESRSGENYNVYAMGKLNDLVDALAGLKLSNAINRALVKSMFALQKAGVTITREILECAASDKIRVKDKGVETLLTRHTVGASTAPTQTSSTLRALETLGIVKVTGTKQNCVVTILDTPQTAALEQVANA